MVEAARVDWAYTDGAYEDGARISWLSVDVEALGACPRKGWLGRRRVGTRSNPNCLTLLDMNVMAESLECTEELLLDEVSKCPDRFSRRFACRAYAESLREIGVVGIGGKAVEIGDILGDGGEFVFIVDAVDGLSLPRL